MMRESQNGGWLREDVGHFFMTPTLPSQSQFLLSSILSKHLWFRYFRCNFVQTPLEMWNLHRKSRVTITYHPGATYASARALGAHFASSSITWWYSSALNLNSFAGKTVFQTFRKLIEFTRLGLAVDFCFHIFVLVSLSSQSALLCFFFCSWFVSFLYVPRPLNYDFKANHIVRFYLCKQVLRTSGNRRVTQLRYILHY